MGLTHIVVLVALIALAVTVVAGIGVLLVAGAGMLLDTSTSSDARRQ